MEAIIQNTWTNSTADDWIINSSIVPDLLNFFLSSSSSGSLKLYNIDKYSQAPISTVAKAHESSIHSFKFFDQHSLASCSTDGIKLWDLRGNCLKPVKCLSTPKKSNFLCLDNKENFLAGGTELFGQDAEVFLWDLRNTEDIVRSFVDSHHDDVTDIKFHPSSSSSLLMSGSTDGYVNVYDLNQKEEDDALHQVINYGSVHSCNFIRDDRIAVLTHFETLCFHPLNNMNYEELQETNPKDMGDVRNLWPNCQYVLKLSPNGFVSYGSNASSSLTLCPFNPHLEEFYLDKSITFPGAHGEEVVRDLEVVPNAPYALTCGEDGSIKCWKLPYTVEFFGDLGLDKSVAENHHSADFSNNSQLKVIDHSGEKNNKKNRKSSKKDKSKKKTDVRFKPY